MKKLFIVFLIISVILIIISINPIIDPTIAFILLAVACIFLFIGCFGLVRIKHTSNNNSAPRAQTNWITPLIGIVVCLYLFVNTVSTVQKSVDSNNSVQSFVSSTSIYDGMTLSQYNAVRSARSYLRSGSFSRSGLIHQLEFEKYSTNDAEFAVDYISPDWFEEAVEAANSYLKLSSFSADGLVDQLMFEGFTRDQANYAVKTVGY